jgi:peptidyl-prolyl cis-trans isomerase SurA
MDPMGVPETMECAMPGMSVKQRTVGRWLACALMAAVMGAPSLARAQVVVLANGSPITDLDIQQRSKLDASATHKTPARQDVINELIDDRLKIAKAKDYGLEVSDAEVNEAFGNMAKRQNISIDQFAQMLDHAGISAIALKARIRAELTWSQLVRGKFQASLQIGDNDIASALRARNETDTLSAGYIYTLYPIMVVAPRGSSIAIMEAKRAEAENLRARFTACNQGLAMARSLRDVAVREPLNRSSGDLAPALRDLLGGMQIGQLTTPEITEQGLQMFALCGKKESNAESPRKRELREEIFNKRFESEGKKFLDEIRKQAMIEYVK